MSLISPHLDVTPRVEETPAVDLAAIAAALDTGIDPALEQMAEVFNEIVGQIVTEQYSKIQEAAEAGTYDPVGGTIEFVATLQAAGVQDGLTVSDAAWQAATEYIDKGTAAIDKMGDGLIVAGCSRLCSGCGACGPKTGEKTGQSTLDGNGPKGAEKNNGSAGSFGQPITKNESSLVSIGRSNTPGPSDAAAKLSQQTSTQTNKEVTKSTAKEATKEAASLSSKRSARIDEDEELKKMRKVAGEKPVPKEKDKAAEEKTFKFSNVLSEKTSESARTENSSRTENRLVSEALKDHKVVSVNQSREDSPVVQSKLNSLTNTMAQLERAVSLPIARGYERAIAQAVTSRVDAVLKIVRDPLVRAVLEQRGIGNKIELLTRTLQKTPSGAEAQTIVKLMRGELQGVRSSGPEIRVGTNTSRTFQRNDRAIASSLVKTTPSIREPRNADRAAQVNTSHRVNRVHTDVQNRINRNASVELTHKVAPRTNQPIQRSSQVDTRQSQATQLRFSSRISDRAGIAIRDVRRTLANVPRKLSPERVQQILRRAAERAERLSRGDRLADRRRTANRQERLGKMDRDTKRTMLRKIRETMQQRRVERRLKTRDKTERSRDVSTRRERNRRTVERSKDRSKQDGLRRRDSERRLKSRSKNEELRTGLSRRDRDRRIADRNKVRAKEIRSKDEILRKREVRLKNEGKLSREENRRNRKAERMESREQRVRNRDAQAERRKNLNARRNADQQRDASTERNLNSRSTRRDKRSEEREMDITLSPIEMKLLEKLMKKLGQQISTNDALRKIRKQRKSSGQGAEASPKSGKKSAAGASATPQNDQTGADADQDKVTMDGAQMTKTLDLNTAKIG